MNCEEISELLPAYVLGALDADELQAVEAHLRMGHEHDAELVELRATVFAMDRFKDDVLEASAAVQPVPDFLLRETTAANQHSGWRVVLGRPRWQGAAVAAVLLLFVFGAGWLVGGLNDSRESYSFLIQGGDGSLMEISGAVSGQKVTVIMDGLDRLDGESYQVWAIRDDTWVSVGVCNTDERGWWKGDFDFALQPEERFALTVEPKGGSAIPSGEPILRSEY